MGLRRRPLRKGAEPDKILRRELLVPIPDTGRIEIGRRRTLGVDEELAFVVVEDDEGRTVLPAFTSERELARWRPEGSPYIALEGQVVIEMLAVSEWDRVVIDGAGASPIGMTRSAARELVGATSRSVSPGSTSLIGQPAEAPPEALVEALRAICSRPEIAEAWLYQFQIVEQDDSPHMALGVLLKPTIDESEVDALLQSFGAEIRPALWGYEFLDLHPLSGELLDSARSNGIPIRP